MTERAAAVAQALRDAGVGSLYGVTGSGFSLSLIEAFETRGGRYYAAVHEGAAAVMAGADAHVSGKPGAVVTIKGPGAANLFPGQLSNAYEGWPVIGISEAYARERAGRAHKLLDQPRVFQPIAKAVAALGDPADVVPSLVAIARAETPGPVHLDVPSRDERAFAPSTPPQAPPRMAASTLDVLRGARRPVVIAGSLAGRQRWGARLAALRVPVLTTVAAKGLLDETLPHAAGVFTGDGGERAPERALLAQADAVVGLGLRSGEVLTPRLAGLPTVIVDAMAGLAEGFEAPVVAPDDLDDLWEFLDRCDWGMPEVETARQVVRARLTERGWSPGSAFLALQRTAPAVRLVADTGLFCTAAEHVWISRHPLDMIASANGRFMGTGLPMAIGAAIADPGKAVVCAVGDGGLPPAFGELRRVLEDRLPIMIVLMTDGGYGSVAGPAGFAARSARATACDRPDWRPIFEAAGVGARTARGVDEFEDAVRAWDRQSPVFLSVPFEAAAYARAVEGVR